MTVPEPESASASATVTVTVSSRANSASASARASARASASARAPVPVAREDREVEVFRTMEGAGRRYHKKKGCSHAELGLTLQEARACPSYRCFSFLDSQAASPKTLSIPN